MTEQTLDNTRTVEVFLHALQDADLDPRQVGQAAWSHSMENR